MPGGAHRAELVRLQLDVRAQPEAPLARWLSDPRLTDARAFFSQAQDQEGLDHVARAEAQLRRAAHDPGASPSFDALANALDARGRALEALALRRAAAEARLTQGDPVDPGALDALAAQAQARGATPLANRARALHARALANDGQHDLARDALQRAWDALQPLDEATAATLWDTKARLLLASGAPDAARDAAAEALRRHEAALDRLAALELERALASKTA
jgi:tetratricopeptide (TPR) repeat protein